MEMDAAYDLLDIVPGTIEISCPSMKPKNEYRLMRKRTEVMLVFPDNSISTSRGNVYIRSVIHRAMWSTKFAQVKVGRVALAHNERFDLDKKPTGSRRCGICTSKPSKDLSMKCKQ